MLQEADIGIGISGVEGMQVIKADCLKTLEGSLSYGLLLPSSNLFSFMKSLFSFITTTFQYFRQSCQVTLQLRNSVIWSAYYLSMGIGVTEGYHQW